MRVLKNFSKFFSYLGQIMAFLTIILLGLVYLNQALPFSFLGENFYNLLLFLEFRGTIYT